MGRSIQGTVRKRKQVIVIVTELVKATACERPRCAEAAVAFGIDAAAQKFAADTIVLRYI